MLVLWGAVSLLVLHAVINTSFFHDSAGVFQGGAPLSAVFVITIMLILGFSLGMAGQKFTEAFRFEKGKDKSALS
ncbi:hypothetical protein [Candidatus Hecatella orcuttiae]|jgi:hypothetical protein|uniref:hypothetical protein n=1 Tax=Candidatus Hecatella orcuttiae TaxID=1935119 RepID=UPI002867B90E|nr:hypothetical protein [Candidatus Hecatella orcuttiae]